MTVFLAWPLTLARAQDDGPLVTPAANDGSELVQGAQQAGAGTAQADSSQTDAAAPQTEPGTPQADPTRQNASGGGATKDPEISWKHFPMRWLQDQKDFWLF
jgi:hypothetical protein